MDNQKDEGICHQQIFPEEISNGCPSERIKFIAFCRPCTTQGKGGLLMLNLKSIQVCPVERYKNNQSNNN